MEVVAAGVIFLVTYALTPAKDHDQGATKKGRDRLVDALGGASA